MSGLHSARNKLGPRSLKSLQTQKLPHMTTVLTGAFTGKSMTTIYDRAVRNHAKPPKQRPSLQIPQIEPQLPNTDNPDRRHNKKLRVYKRKRKPDRVIQQPTDNQRALELPTNCHKAMIDVDNS